MKTVLLVDGSKVVRTMMTRHLHRWGCRVQEASDGGEALAAVRRDTPDLILLDLAMPVTDGRRCLTELRREPAGSSVPVIALSTESGRGEDLAGLGVAGVLVKPFQQDAFDREVAKILGGQ